MDLTIIILTWNTKDYLKNCIKSIEKYKDNVKYEIIVVDNGSTDGTPEMIQKDFTNTILVRNDVNCGTSARNKGLQIAKGRYIAFLDSDIEIIENNSFSEMINYLDNNKTVGLLAPKLIFENGELQYNCKEFLSFYTPILRIFESFEIIRNLKIYRKQLMADWNHDSIKEIDYAISAFWMFRRELIGTIGVLDPNIFYAPDDVDYCLRIWKGNYKVTYYPFVVAKHFCQRITRKRFSVITYEHIKGLFYFFWKHKYLIKPKLNKRIA